MRIAITGSNGRLGAALVAACHSRGHEPVPFARPEHDITRDADLQALSAWQPDIVVNSAAWTDVDGCARDPERALHINGRAAGSVARAAARARAVSVQVSTNEVFDGRADRPYRESDVPAPVNPYGRSKLLGEKLALENNPLCIVIRTAWLFGGNGASFPEKILGAAERARRTDEPLAVVSDEVGNPTPVDLLADRILDLLDRRDAVQPHDVFHVAGTPPISRYDWAREILAPRPDLRIRPITLLEHPRDTTVPPAAVLDTSKAVAAGLAPIAWRRQSKLAPADAGGAQ